MKRRQIIMEAPAHQDIEAAYGWLAERELEAANRWFNALHDTIISLELFPERCPLAPESKSFKAEIREIFHGRRHNKYRILFTVNETAVHILHVRHGARFFLSKPASGEY